MHDFTLTATIAEGYDETVSRGACRPQVAHRALEADPRDTRTRVSVFDPMAMTSFSDAAEVAHEARERLAGMLAALHRVTEGEARATGA